MNSITIRSAPPKTMQQYDFILLDASSSMYDKWNDTLKAIQAYVQTLKWEQIDTHIQFHSFSTQSLECEHFNGPIALWNNIPTHMMGGGTPLYDAISVMCFKLRELDPARAAITIGTDGEECDSRFTSEEQAKALLDWCRAKGWQVTIIGCEFNNSNLASRLGATSQSAIGVQKLRLTDAAKSLGKKRAHYSRTGEPMHFTDSERQQFGGYLAGPGK